MYWLWFWVAGSRSLERADTNKYSKVGYSQVKRKETVCLWTVDVGRLKTMCKFACRTFQDWWFLFAIVHKFHGKGQQRVSLYFPLNAESQCSYWLSSKYLNKKCLEWPAYLCKWCVAWSPCNTLNPWQVYHTTMWHCVAFIYTLHNSNECNSVLL